jgi:hypothetical protein
MSTQLELVPDRVLPEAPSDAAAEQAWDQIMQLAVSHALVVDAAGGVATLAIPREQRAAGLRDVVLRMHRMREVS